MFDAVARPRFRDSTGREGPLGPPARAGLVVARGAFGRLRIGNKVVVDLKNAARHTVAGRFGSSVGGTRLNHGGRVHPGRVRHRRDQPKRDGAAADPHGARATSVLPFALPPRRQPPTSYLCLARSCVSLVRRSMSHAAPGIPTAQPRPCRGLGSACRSGQLRSVAIVLRVARQASALRCKAGAFRADGRFGLTHPGTPCQNGGRSGCKWTGDRG